MERKMKETPFPPAYFLCYRARHSFGEDDRLLRTYGLPRDTILQQMLLL